MLCFVDETLLLPCYAHVSELIEESGSLRTMGLPILGLGLLVSLERRLSLYISKRERKHKQVPLCLLQLCR